MYCTWTSWAEAWSCLVLTHFPSLQVTVGLTKGTGASNNFANTTVVYVKPSTAACVQNVTGNITIDTTSMAGTETEDVVFICTVAPGSTASFSIYSNGALTTLDAGSDVTITAADFAAPGNTDAATQNFAYAKVTTPTQDPTPYDNAGGAISMTVSGQSSRG